MSCDREQHQDSFEVSAGNVSIDVISSAGLTSIKTKMQKYILAYTLQSTDGSNMTLEILSQF